MISSSRDTTSENITTPQLENETEAAFDSALRPKQLADFIGQQHLKQNLNILIDAAKIRNEPVEHILFYGPPGLGKTTLAHIIAAETGGNLKITAGPAIERSGDLAALLTNLEDNDVLFIDEIHRMNKAVEEVLYPALEDRVLDIMLGKGPGSRSVRMELPKFTLVGATTRLALLANPLRDRFGVVEKLEYYTTHELRDIIVRSAQLLNAPIHPEAAELLAQRSRFTPRIANRILKRVRDGMQVVGKSEITSEVALETLQRLAIDELGLDKNDREIMLVLAEKFSGKPVGLNTLAAATGEEEDSIANVYEPFLIQLGFLQRTPKGRQLTERGYSHIGKTPPRENTLL